MREKVEMSNVYVARGMRMKEVRKSSPPIQVMWTDCGVCDNFFEMTSWNLVYKVLFFFDYFPQLCFKMPVFFDVYLRGEWVLVIRTSGLKHLWRNHIQKNTVSLWNLLLQPNGKHSRRNVSFYLWKHWQHKGICDYQNVNPLRRTSQVSQGF